MAGIIRVSLKGTMPGGEVWSVNPTFWHDIGSPPSSVAGMEDAAAAINAITMPGQLLSAMASSCAITETAVESRTLQGELVQIATVQRPSGGFSGAGAAAKPFQTSLVVSLRTSAPGVSGRGRLYWPATGMAIDNATLRVPLATRDPFASQFAAYLLSIRDSLSDILGLPGLQLAVWSRRLNAANVVARVQVGNVFDTQRRRRDSAAESYVSVVTPPAT